ncbi:hypothetical protein ILUMI_15747, partial [Ignelater luminosus]
MFSQTVSVWIPVKYYFKSKRHSGQPLIELRRPSLSTLPNLSLYSYKCEYNAGYSDDDQTFNPNEYESIDDQDNIEPKDNINNVENNHTKEDSVSVNAEKEKKHRARRRKPENWKMNVRKQKRNSSLEYVITTGKLRLPRYLKNVKQECYCKLKCHEKLDDDARAQIFKNFWNLRNIDLQRGFICKYVGQKVLDEDLLKLITCLSKELNIKIAIAKGGHN